MSTVTVQQVRSPVPAGHAAGPRARRRPFAAVPAAARQYAVRMPDGVRLATDVYLPAAGTRWAALVCRLPYDKAGAECFLPQIAWWFTERGYAVVVQDVRGKVRSGGDFEPFAAEIGDGYHTLDWVAAQSWCDGALGMLGDSYYGFTQWAAAASRHPALRAIAPRVCAADMRCSMDRQGVFPLEVMACWALETWVDETLYDYDGELDWTVRPLAEIVPAAAGGRRPAGLDDWAHGRLPAAATVPVRGQVPALHLGGFADFMLRGQLAAWRDARAAARAPQYLMLDATDHGWTPLREPGQPWHDPQVSDAAMGRFLDGYLGPLLPFFGHFLRGAAGYRPAPVRWRLARDTATWRETDQWPPAGSAPVTWALAGRPATGDGALADRAGPAASTASWVHDPGQPVPSRIHPYYPLISPPDEQDVHARADVLAFTTDPLDRPLDLAGPAAVQASLTSSADSAHLIATLGDVFPDGSTHRILDGAARVQAPWPARVTVDLGDTGYRLRPGHRLRLTLASSAFPRYALHPGTSGDPWTAITAAPAQQGIVLGGPDGAQLTCQVLGPAGGTR